MKYDVAMLCAYMHMSTNKLAEKAGIDKWHLASVRAGRARMSGDDLIKLSEVTGISAYDIQTSNEYYKGLYKK